MKTNVLLTLIFVILLSIQNGDSKKLKASQNYDDILSLSNGQIITYQLTAKKAKLDNLSLISLQNNLRSGTAEKTETSHIIQSLTKKITEYSGIVKIGNPPQEFEMVFDTGSANFIVASSKCVSGGCGGHKKYNSDESSTAKIVAKLQEHNEDYVFNPLGRDQVHIRFGTGNVQCLMTQDSVCLGEGKNFCVENLLILEAIYESEIPFASVQFDGIIGLSHSHLSVNSQSNFINILVKEKKISQKVFSFYFNKNDLHKSEIHIGGINLEKLTGNIYFSNVISKSYWEIGLTAIYYGDVKLPFCQNIACTAVIDTGTSMIAGPTQMINTLMQYSHVNEDCSNLGSLKNIKFEINGSLFNLDPEYYVMKLTDDDAEIINKKRVTSPQDVKCINAFMNLNALSNGTKLTMILGSPFLKKYYTVFDREKSRIGFAVANHLEHTEQIEQKSNI